MASTPSPRKDLSEELRHPTYWLICAQVRAPNTGKMMTVVIPAGVGPGGQFAVPLPMPVASYGARSRPKGNAAARRQYQQARRRGDGRLHKVHWGVVACVEINQCVGCIGDDAVVLAPSSGEESASPRYRAGGASMAWRTTR